MDDLISRVLEPILQRFLTNFKREQLTVSFMKGRGVMRNLVVNTRELNNLLRNAPFRVSHITIDQLSIKASLTRITTRPVTVFIDHIDVDLYEPWGTPQQEEATKPGPAKPNAASARRSYGLADRITDGVRVEIKEVRVRIRTLGKRKCPKPGPWNPPDGLLVLRGVRLFSTDELGFEGDLEECWRYNKGRKGARDFFVFKKSTVQSVSFSLLPRRRPAAGSSPPPPIPLLVDVPVETVICLRRSLHDVSVLFGVDVEVRLDRASIRLARADGSFAFLVSFLAGLGHCVSGSAAAKPSGDPLCGDGPDAALDGSYTSSRLRGHSEASASMGGGGRTASMEEAERDKEGGQEDEQGGEEGEEDEEEDDEESVGSEDSGFSHGQQSSLAPDFSLTGDLSMSIADDDRQTASDEASLSYNGAPSTAAAGRPTAPHARVALGLCVSRGEVRLVDDGVGGFVLSLGNLRLELIHGEDMAPSEAITQAYLTYFELRELGADESPLLRQPALIRPHDDASASATGPGFDTVFPDCEPRGVRDTSDFPPSAEGLQTCDVLCVKTHTLAFPALPPPAMSAETDVNLDRLHLVADVAAWVRLGNFITRHTDQRCLTGEWGAEVEGYVIQQLPAKGIRHVTLRSAGFTLHLPPGPSPADCALSRGAYVELSVGKLTLGLSDALPRSFAAQDGFLDARLRDAAAHPPIPTPQELQAQGSASLSPFRLKLTLADVSLTAPYLSGGAGPVTLVSPLSLAFLLSVDALCPIFDPPEGTLYVPLSNLSQLSLSVAVDTLAVQVHLPAWLALADSLLAHLETLHDRLVLPEAALPSPQPGGGPTPLTYLLRGAGLHAVVKVCSIRLTLPGLTAMEGEVAADGSTGKAEGGQQAHILRVEAVDTQTVLSVSPSGDLDCGSLLGGCRVCTSSGDRGVVLLELARLGTAVAPASSEQKGEGVSGSEEQHYCNDAFCRSCPDKAPGPSGSGVVLARVQCQGPRPSSQRSSFLRQPGSSACHEDTGGEGAWGRGAGAGIVDEAQVSIDVKEGAAITAPLPVLQAVLDELHALLSAQADVHGLASHQHAHPDPRFPEGSIGRLLLSGGGGPSPPAARPATPRALHGRLLLLLLRVRVSVDRLVVQIPLEDGPDPSTTVVLLEASAPEVRGRLLLQPRGAPPPDQEDDEAFSTRWEATGTVGYWLAGAGQGGCEQQAAGRRTVVQDLQLQLFATPAAGRAGGWLVDCVPPPEQVRMHTGPDWSEARAALRAGLDRLKQHPLLGGRGSRKRALPTQIQGLVPSAEQRQAAEGAEDVRLLEAMEASAWSSQVAWAAQAGEQVSALRQGMRRAAAEAEREREQLREKVAVLRAALRAKEVQRQHLLAMHHADHVGFLRVGPQQSKPAQQLKRKGGSSKALLSLPRYWCVLRQGLLLCYDQPHSLRLVEHFPLYRCALADYVPQDAKTHYRRAYALVYRAKAAGPRQFLFVAESEEDLQAWKAALEPHLLTSSTPASPSSRAGPGLSARSTPPPPQSPPRSAPSTPPNRPSTRRGPTGRTPTPGERAGSTSSMSIKTGASAAPGGGGGVKSLRHSFSFSPGRLLKASSGGGGRKTPTTRWHRSMSDAATELAVPDGATGTPLLVAEAERVRRLDVRATAVTPAVKEAAAREPLSSPCFIITSARADPALKPRRSSTTPLQRLVSASAMSESAPAAPSSPDGGRKGGQADLEGCVARSFADLLAFHGGYVERWSCVMEEAQGTASSPRAGGGRPSLSALLQPFASGMSEAEALSYANQLLVGSQKLLQAYASDEHTRRQQVELVDRYLKLLASCCPADRQCLDLLTDLLGLSAALPGTPPRVLSPSREAPSTTLRARSLSPPLPPHHQTRNPDRRSITPPLPPSLAIEPGISSASSSLRSCASRGEQAAPATDDLASQQRSLRSCEAGVGSQSPPSLRRWARPCSPRASGLTRPKAVPVPGGFLSCDTQVPSAAVSIDPWDDDHDGDGDKGTQRHSSAEELEGAVQALGRLEAALRGQRTAMLLQGTLLDEYRSAWRVRREAMAKELQARAAQWRECRGRAAWLEDRLKRAELAKEDALFAMTEVTSYSAQKLMEAEARYMNLLKAAHTADKHGRSAHHRGHGSTGKQHRRATSSSAPTVTQQQQQQRAAGLERQGSGRHQHQHVSLSPVSSNGTIAAQAAGGQLPRRPSESSAWSSLDENSPIAPPGSSSDALDRLARALERKSQEACRAHEAMLMAMEEAHGLRDALQQTRRLAALDRAAGRAGPSGKEGGIQQDKEEDVEEDGSLEGRIRALEAALRKERGRADRLQAELTTTQERWRSFSCKAAQILALPSREEEGEQGKRMEQDDDTAHESAALLTQLSQVRSIVS